jgi:small-conductance mechanosensitive channel/CRP-like cAMP-binding protein
MSFDPQAFEGWQRGLAFGLLIAFGGELALLALRQLARRKRIGFLQHAWALSAGVFTFLGFLTRVPPLLDKLAAAALLLLSVHVAYVTVDELLLRRPWDRDAGPFLPKLGIDVVRTLLLVTAALFVANRVFDAQLSAILVSSTVLSAVLGFALQDVLRNVFAGMAIQLEQPFEIGHWLMIDGQPAQVVEMTWRTTRLRTNEGRFLLQPNAEVAAARLEWLGTGDPPVAFGFRVGLGYDAPPAKVKEALLEAAAGAPGAVSDPAPQAFVDAFDDSAITYHLRVWTRQVRRVVVFRDAVQTRIWYALQRHGLTVPFPIRTLHFNDMEKVDASQAAADATRVAALLSGIDLFRELEPTTVQQLAAAAQRKHYADGEVMVSEGDDGDSLFLIEEGSAGVAASGSAGGPRVPVAMLGPGSFFGEMSLLTGEPRSATVTASTSCAVLVLDRASVAPVISDDPNVAWVLSRALAARAAETAEKLAEHDRTRSAAAGEITEANILKKIRGFFGLR